MNTFKVDVDRTFPALRDGDITAEETHKIYEAGEVKLFYGEGPYDYFSVRRNGENLEVRASGLGKMYVVPRGSGTIEIGADK